jgi:hypothetical protein
MPEYTIGAVESDDRLDEIVAYLSQHEIEAARERGEIDPVASVQTIKLFDGRTTIAIRIVTPGDEKVR